MTRNMGTFDRGLRAVAVAPLAIVVGFLLAARLDEILGRGSVPADAAVVTS